jgi:hypothetical protein
MDSSDESRPTRRQHEREELVEAFPSSIRQDALIAIAALSEHQSTSRWESFSLRLGNEVLTVPQRVYYAPPVQAVRFNHLQIEIQNCVFTRHHDGFVRQTHLARIIRSQNAWIPCFVVPLVGEYVVEILHIIHENLPYLNASVYAEFLRANPEFLKLTEQRVFSYWNCYYRSTKRHEYPGFLILDYFRSIVKT